ncbi:MAG: HD domain-containing protein, partial [Clostridia bacterium]|nr:HD domain-containing protein [Clostridia bacterium]
MRVVDLCKLLASYEEGIDTEILLVSALLHDIARISEDQDLTGETDHAALGAQKAGDILK